MGTREPPCGHRNSTPWDLESTWVEPSETQILSLWIDGCRRVTNRWPKAVWWCSYGRFSKVHVLFFFQTLGLWIIACTNCLRNLLDLLCFDAFGYGIRDPRIESLRIGITRTCFFLSHTWKIWKRNIHELELRELLPYLFSLSLPFRPNSMGSETLDGIS